MLVSQCYGKNIYIDDKLVGYIQRLDDGDAAIYIANKRFARLTYDGLLLIQGNEVGYIDDDGDVYLNGKHCGEITSQNDIVLYGNALN